MQHHLLIGYKKEIRLDYPDRWDELTEKQAIYAGKLMYRLTKKDLDPDQFRKLMVDKFIRRDNRGNNKLPNMDASIDMWANEGLLMETVNFFFKITKREDGVEQFEILPTGIKNLIPAFRHRLRKYYGPGEFLHGMTFAQFKDALTCSQKYMETMDDYWLIRLAATLYREKSKAFYHIDEVDRRSARLKRLNKGILYMAFCYFMGCMHNLRTDGDGEGIEVDGILCRFSLIFAGSKNYQGGGEGIGMLGVLMTLAESGVFGGLKETANADIWDVLPRLYQLKLEAIEMEKSLKK